MERVLVKEFFKMSVMRAIRRYKWPQNEHTADLIRYGIIIYGFFPFSSQRLLVDDFLRLNHALKFVPHFRELRLSWTAGAAMSDGMEKFVEEFLPRIRHELKILATIQQLSLGGDFRTGIKLGVTPRLPRGQELLDIETRGHDVFSIYSKYKGDPIDPHAMTSMKHPHLKYQPMIKKKHTPPAF